MAIKFWKHDAAIDLLTPDQLKSLGIISVECSAIEECVNGLLPVAAGTSEESAVVLLGAGAALGRKIEMLQELVDVSRGRVHPTEVCSLSEIITAATETQTAAADSNGVRIGVEISKGIELPLERARIERVFQNLLSNAIDAMPNGGTIEVRAEVTGEAVVVHVEDNGPGIPAEVRQGLFQPFTTSSKNGLGLGLALSRQTVLDHGGDLWVEEGSKRGAHFLLRFPR